jgi:hypothetical protein
LQYGLDHYMIIILNNYLLFTRQSS